MVSRCFCNGICKDGCTMDWVYIPTLGRADDLKNVWPHWSRLGFGVRFVVEPHEYEKTWDALALDTIGLCDVQVITLPASGQGVAYARQYALRHAHRNQCDAIILADDDVIPAPKPKRGRLFQAGLDPGNRMPDLLKVVRGQRVWPGQILDGYPAIYDGPPTLGCAASQPLYDFITGGKITDPMNDELINLHVQNCFAVNVDIALSIGGFDTDLTHWDDQEFVIRGIHNGYPWLTHTACHFKQLKRSGAEGGTAVFLEAQGITRKQEEERNRARVAAKYPKYVAAPPKRPRVAWAKMYDDFKIRRPWSHE